MSAPRVAGVLSVLMLLSWQPANVNLLCGQEQVPSVRVLQDTTLIQVVKLRDGTTWEGRVIAVEGDWVRFMTLGGVEVRFRSADVASVREVRGVRGGARLWRRDPSDSRLFLAPTARVPESGHGYFGVYELFFPSAAVGIAGFAMISGGVSIFPGISLSDQIFYIAPKIRFLQIDVVSAAVALVWVRPGDADESAGMVYGALTAGSETASFTGGIAFPFVSDTGFSDEPVPVLGGEFRVSKALKLMTENWISLAEGGALLSLGGRVISGQFTAELAGVLPTEGDFVLPVVNVSFGW